MLCSGVAAALGRNTRLSTLRAMSPEGCGKLGDTLAVQRSQGVLRRGSEGRLAGVDVQHLGPNVRGQRQRTPQDSLLRGR